MARNPIRWDLTVPMCPRTTHVPSPDRQSTTRRVAPRPQTPELKDWGWLYNPNAVIRLKLTLPPRSERPHIPSHSYGGETKIPNQREAIKRTAIPYSRTSNIETRSTHAPNSGSRLAVNGAVPALLIGSWQPDTFTDEPPERRCSPRELQHHRPVSC